MSYYPLNSIPDYYGIDDLLTEEHILIRNSVRDWVQSFIMPQIDDAAQHHKDIPNLMKELGAIEFLILYSRRIWRCWLDQILWIDYARVRTRRFCGSFCGFCSEFLVMFLFLNLFRRTKGKIFQN